MFSTRTNTRLSAKISFLRDFFFWLYYTNLHRREVLVNVTFDSPLKYVATSMCVWRGLLLDLRQRYKEKNNIFFWFPYCRYTIRLEYFFLGSYNLSLFNVFLFRFRLCCCCDRREMNTMNVSKFINMWYTPKCTNWLLNILQISARASSQWCVMV